MVEKKAVMATRERDENGLWKVEKYRLEPPVAGFDHLPWLTEEDKELGRKELAKYFNTGSESKDDWGIDNTENSSLAPILWHSSLICLLRDPKSYKAFFTMFDSVVPAATGFDSTSELMVAGTHKKGIDSTAKGKDPDVRRRTRNVHLMLLAIGHERQDDYWLRVFSLMGLTEADENGSYLMRGEKLVMCHNPDSSVWADEESLALKFAYATLRREMSDEIWDRAIAAWGEQETLRYLMLIGTYDMEFTIQRALFREKFW